MESKTTSRAASLDRLSKALNRKSKPTDEHVWGTVESVNADGSYQVRINASGDAARCAACCTAETGDRVLVTIMADGKCAAVGRLGGEAPQSTATVLYYDPVGTAGDFELSDSAENYSVIDVTAKYADGVECGFFRVYEPNGKTIDLTASIPATNLAISRTRLTFSGTSVTQAYNEQWNEESTSGTPDVLKVSRVVGYSTMPNDGIEQQGGGGTGATFFPSVSEEGVISWTNDGGYANPDPVNIKGYTPVKGTDYFTEADIQECAEAAAELVEVPTVPTNVSAFVNDVGYITEEDLSGLPAGYVAANYIKSTGTQYVDTDFWPDQNTRVVMDVELTSGTAENQWYFAARQAKEDDAFGAFCYKNFLGAAYGDEQSEEVRSYSTVSREIIDINRNVVTMAGEGHTFTATLFSTRCSLTLLARNTKGSVATFAKAKLYSCRIYDNGTLVRDFVPCINPNGEAGLYDKVSSAFYGNAGEGAFTAG